MADDGRKTRHRTSPAHLTETHDPGSFRRLRCFRCEFRSGPIATLTAKTWSDVHLDRIQSPRSDFEKEVESAGWGDRVLYLDRGDAFEFGVRG